MASQPVRKDNLKRIPSVRQANLLFMLVLVFYALLNFLPLGLRALSIHVSLPSSLLADELIIEVGLLLIPTLLAIFFLKLDLRTTLNIRPLSARSTAVSIGIGLVAWPIAFFFTVPVQFIMSQIGPLPSPIEPARTLPEALTLLAILSLLAPVCEETLNRGFIFSAYTRSNPWHAVLVSGLFFGLFHMSPTRFLATGVLGFILGYVVYRTGSIFASMIVHATHNAVIFTIAQSVQQVVNVDQANQEAQKLVTRPEYLIGSLIFWGVVSLVSAAILYVLFQHLPDKQIGSPVPVPPHLAHIPLYGYPPLPSEPTPYAPVPIYHVPLATQVHVLQPATSRPGERAAGATARESTNPFHYWSIVVVLCIFVLFSGLEIAVRANLIPSRRPATPPTPESTVRSQMQFTLNKFTLIEIAFIDHSDTIIVSFK